MSPIIRERIQPPPIPLAYVKADREKAAMQFYAYRGTVICIVLLTVAFSAAFARLAIMQSKLLVQEIFAGEVR